MFKQIATYLSLWILRKDAMPISIQQHKSDGSFLAHSTTNNALCAEFEFKVQPIVHPKSGAVFAYEVLSHVSDSSGEHLYSEDFFEEIDNQFLQQLFLTQIEYLRPHIIEHGALLSFNIPLVCLNDDEFVNTLVQLIDFPIAIEVTCAQLTLNCSGLAQNVKKLRSHGIQMWLDDYNHKDKSKTHALQYFRWDAIKLDKTYLLYHDNDEIICMLTELLGLYASLIIVEGIETAYQHILHLCPNLLMQGYFYYYPMDVKLAIPLFKEHHSDYNESLQSLAKRPKPTSSAIDFTIE